MTKKNKEKAQWTVVVGQPKLEYWAHVNSTPNMESVDKVVIGWTNESGTRKEAIEYAKVCSLSKSWKFHAKKV